MDAAEAYRFVEQQGVVLESASGPVPTLTHQIVGERIRGSWWSHPASHHIYAVLSSVRDSADVLVFRLISGKITYVHHRMWAGLVRLADVIGPARLAAVDNVHTVSGRHETVETPFPEWVDAETRTKAATLDEAAARASLPPLLFI